MKICDRCKKEINNEDFTGVCGYINSKKAIEKDFCEECMTDIMNIIDIECDNGKIYDVEYKEIK